MQFLRYKDQNTECLRHLQSSPCKIRLSSALPNPIPQSSVHLCLLKSSGETSDVVGQLALVGQELDIGTVNQDLSSSLLLHVFFTAERSEAPVLGNDDLLASRELVL